MGPTHVFRTTFAKVLTVAAAVVIAIAAGYSLVDGGLTALWQTLPFLAVAGGVIWVLFGNPRVEVSDGGVTVVNIVRQVHVPWPTLRGVDSQWSLSVKTTAGTYSSWAIPAASGMGMRLQNPRKRGGGLSESTAVRRANEEAADRAVASGQNASAVALTIADRLKSLTEAGHLGGHTIGTVEPHVRWNVRELLVLAVVAALVVALVL